MTKNLQDTGERLIPEYHKGQAAYGEHIARYNSVLPITRNKTVLDIACGSGYGSKVIVTTAKQVIGIDIDKDTIAYAKQHYADKKIKYLVGDGVDIPLDNNSIDVVVSFETFEHIENYRQFLKELKRVVKPNGQVIISTPNEKEFTHSHYHVHEFTYSQFSKLLKEYWRNIDMYYQAIWQYSGVFEAELLEREWVKRLEITNASPIPEANRAVYYVAVCGDGNLPQLHQQGVLGQWYRPKQRFLNDMRTHHRIKQLESIETRLKNLLNQKNQELEQMTSSHSWRITKPLRIIARYFRK